jgi:hypothetical protein
MLKIFVNDTFPPIEFLFGIWKIENRKSKIYRIFKLPFLLKSNKETNIEKFQITTSSKKITLKFIKL